MIDSKELRIGNKILRMGNVVTVSTIDDCREDHYSGFLIGNYEDLASYTPKEYEPIPLTPEILERCGFEDTSGGYRATGSEVVFSKLINQSVKIDLWEQWPTGYSLPYYGNKLESLHQLQNLYFALTGEELEIKELQHT